jgi:hypothetical protein
MSLDKKGSEGRHDDDAIFDSKYKAMAWSF